MSDMQSWYSGVKNRVTATPEGGVIELDDLDELSMVAHAAHLIAEAALSQFQLPEPHPPRFKVEVIERSTSPICRAVHTAFKLIAQWDDERGLLRKQVGPFMMEDFNIPPPKDLKPVIHLVYSANPVGVLIRTVVEFRRHDKTVFLQTHPHFAVKRI